MNNITPTVSVLLPIFNAESFLTQAIESILSQTYDNFELLAINDGSTDSSLEILNSYKDPRLKVINNDRNKGLIYTLNKGIEIAKGKYIARMDADDISLPNRLKLQVEFLELNPSIALLGGFAEFIDDKNTVFNLCKVPLTHDDIMQKIFSVNCFVHPSVMFRTSVVREFEGYRTQAFHAEDYDLWLRIIQRYKVANISEILLQYRIHPNQISQRQLSAQRKAADKARFEASIEYRKTLNDSLIDAPIKPLNFWQRLRGVHPSVGRDYFGWIMIYKTMGRHDIAKKLIIPALCAAPFCTDLYLELFPPTITRINRRWGNLLRWYFKRIIILLKMEKN